MIDGELKYPIMYSVLELRINGGWTYGYNDETIGYIVSKCFVVESKIKYFKNGLYSLSHKVVYPYTDFHSFYFSNDVDSAKLPEENIVRYDAKNNPYPADIVEKLFDRYEDAVREAEIKNLELKKTKISQLRYKDGESVEDTIKKFEEKFSEGMRRCKLFEALVSEATKDDFVIETDKINLLEPVN